MDIFRKVSIFGVSLWNSGPRSYQAYAALLSGLEANMLMEYLFIVQSDYRDTENNSIERTNIHRVHEKIHSVEISSGNLKIVF